MPGSRLTGLPTHFDGLVKVTFVSTTPTLS